MIRRSNATFFGDGPGESRDRVRVSSRSRSPPHPRWQVPKVVVESAFAAAKMQDVGTELTKAYRALRAHPKDEECIDAVIDTLKLSAHRVKRIEHRLAKHLPPPLPLQTDQSPAGSASILCSCSRELAKAQAEIQDLRARLRQAETRATLSTVICFDVDSGSD